MKIKKNGKVITLTESDMKRIKNKVITEFMFRDDDMDFKTPNRKERELVSYFKKEILNKLNTGGGDWATNVPDPSLTNLINGIRRVCDKYENM